MRKYVRNKLQVHQCPVRRIIRVRETRICSCGFRGTRVYETYVFPKIIGSQAHFRKVAVHVVGKSGCVLHARATTTGARAVWWNLQPKPDRIYPQKWVSWDTFWSSLIDSTHQKCCQGCAMATWVPWTGRPRSFYGPARCRTQHTQFSYYMNAHLSKVRLPRDYITGISFRHVLSIDQA